MAPLSVGLCSGHFNFGVQCNTNSATALVNTGVHSSAANDYTVVATYDGTTATLAVTPHNSATSTVTASKSFNYFTSPDKVTIGAGELLGATVRKGIVSLRVVGSHDGTTTEVWTFGTIANIILAPMNAPTEAPTYAPTGCSCISPGGWPCVTSSGQCSGTGNSATSDQAFCWSQGMGYCSSGAVVPSPTSAPSNTSTYAPTYAPTNAPSHAPSNAPTTHGPTAVGFISKSPSQYPTTPGT